MLPLLGLLLSCGSKKVTYEDYNKVKEGMTYEEVVEVVGEEGDQMSSINIEGAGQFEGASSKAYKWQNSDGSNMIVMFSNGEVMSKSQTMLK